MLTDLVGLVGLGCLAAGLYIQFGTGPALIISGVLLLTVAVAAGWRGGQG